MSETLDARRGSADAAGSSAAGSGDPRRARQLPTTLLTAVARPFAWLTLVGWLATAAILASLFYPGYLYADDVYWLELYSRYMALALFALSVDLVWGYTGLLSLGQGLYFGLGVYMVGYSLQLQKAAQLADKPLVAAPDMAMPGFMEVMGRLSAVPSWIGEGGP